MGMLERIHARLWTWLYDIGSGSDLTADTTPNTVVSVIRQEKVTNDVTFTITLARGEPLAESYVTENEGAFKTVDGIAILCESFCDELG